MHRRVFTFLAVAFVAALSLPEGRAQTQTAPVPVPVPASDDTYQDTLLLNRVIEIIRQDYVDEGKTGDRALTYAALSGMLASLDPHSQFLNEEAFAEMQKDTKGEFAGLGLILGVNKENALIIASVLEETPGYRAGLLPGDRLLKINDLATEKMPYTTALKNLRGKKGEKIRLTLYRPPEKEGESVPAPAAVPSPVTKKIFEVELVRETIHVHTVKEVKLLPPETAGDEKIGYLRLEQFGENTVSEFDKALEALQKQGAAAIVIDLRNNPGGLLTAAVDVAGAFLPPGTMVVSTEGRTPESRREYRSTRAAAPVTIPLALLVNGYSASGSEIVAGALQDLHRALLVGETTFGKGSVQSVLNLGNGVGVRLTTAKYYTPAHRVINEHGVDPDIPAPVPAQDDRNLIRLRTPSLLTEQEKLDLKDFHDTQLERAAAALRGILIHAKRGAAAGA